MCRLRSRSKFIIACAGAGACAWSSSTSGIRRACSLRLRGRSGELAETGQRQHGSLVAASSSVGKQRQGKAQCTALAAYATDCRRTCRLLNRALQLAIGNCAVLSCVDPLCTPPHRVTGTGLVLVLVRWCRRSAGPPLVLPRRRRRRSSPITSRDSLCTAASHHPRQRPRPTQPSTPRRPLLHRPRPAMLR